MNTGGPPSDPYTVLGIQRTATTTQIKNAYRKLAFKYHPDVATKGGNEKRFNEINEAYQLLVNRSKRASLDSEQSRHNTRQGHHRTGGQDGWVHATSATRKRKAYHGPEGHQVFNTPNPYEEASARSPNVARAPQSEAAYESLRVQQMGASKLAHLSANQRAADKATRLAVQQGAHRTRVNFAFCALPFVAAFGIYKWKSSSEQKKRNSRRS